MMCPLSFYNITQKINLIEQILNRCPKFDKKYSHQKTLIFLRGFWWFLKNYLRNHFMQDLKKLSNRNVNFFYIVLKKLIKRCTNSLIFAFK